MKWISVKDQLPPYNTPVLAYLACPDCWNNEEHRHTLAINPWTNNVNKIYIAIWKPADLEMKKFYENKPNSGWEKYFVDRWNPIEPTYWMPMVDKPTKESIEPRK